MKEQLLKEGGVEHPEAAIKVPKEVQKMLERVLQAGFGCFNKKEGTLIQLVASGVINSAEKKFVMVRKVPEVGLTTVEIDFTHRRPYECEGEKLRTVTLSLIGGSLVPGMTRVTNRDAVVSVGEIDFSFIGAELLDYIEEHGLSPFEVEDRTRNEQIVRLYLPGSWRFVDLASVDFNSELVKAMMATSS